ncbi:MAG: arginine--tRNA ligase [Minisyncoccia bacterium]|jgi:arginyl-tRNA synthetase
MKEKIVKILEDTAGRKASLIDVFVPERENFGHYSTNVAMRLGGAEERSEEPLARAERLAAKVAKAAPAGFFEKVEAVPPGFVNFWLSKKTTQEEFQKIVRDARFGTGEAMKGKTVMVEFTDPNPFKLFHIGHLMSNTVGESFACLYEAAGAKVIRANYQGDVGLHVAKAVWGMEEMSKQHREKKLPGENAPLAEKIAFLGDAYAFGARAYEDQSDAKKQIETVNEAIYRRTNAAVNQLYDAGLRWSLAYFETIYKRLGTKFDRYFFENEMGEKGLALVRARRDIFKESDGAIVFHGEEYGLHTRVFVNSRGLPTYEAKELGLNTKKFELYPLDLSVIVTGNEIVDYFRVLLKAMELVAPEIAAKTRHVPHGMLRLATGKMSSRTGEVVTAESLLEQAKEKIRERMTAAEGKSAAEREEIAEAVAIGAVKYSILKQNPGQDIAFDFDKSLSFEGDSGPYVQYAYARLASILRKAGMVPPASDADADADAARLDSELELAVIRKIMEFPDVVSHAAERHLPSGVAAYLYKFASLVNRFYETTPVLKEKDAARRNARLALVRVASEVLIKGLALLGVRAPEKI